MSRELSTKARLDRAARLRRQEVGWARRSSSVSVRPLVAQSEGECGGCLLTIRRGEPIALFRSTEPSWWGHIGCVQAARGVPP